MPATPAWPPAIHAAPVRRDRTRALARCASTARQAHYLIQVMRMKAGDPVKLFDDAPANGSASRAMGKRDLVLDVTASCANANRCPTSGSAPRRSRRAGSTGSSRRPASSASRGWRRCSPGAAVVDKLNLDRLRSHMIEAAEQCGRTALPELVEPVKLAAMLRDWPAERTLFFADETGGLPALEAMRAIPAPPRS
jgi:16S rRNA (uracil1498-N3)-methyltransferase